jgi:hypothetical protein
VHREGIIKTGGEGHLIIYISVIDMGNLLQYKLIYSSCMYIVLKKVPVYRYPRICIHYMYSVYSNHDTGYIYNLLVSRYIDPNLRILIGTRVPNRTFSMPGADEFKNK